ADEDLDATYWWQNVRRPVRFAAAVERVLGEGFDVLVEVGPHPVLRPYLRRISAAARLRTAVIPTLRRPDQSPTTANPTPSGTADSAPLGTAEATGDPAPPATAGATQSGTRPVTLGSIPPETATTDSALGTAKTITVGSPPSETPTTNTAL